MTSHVTGAAHGVKSHDDSAEEAHWPYAAESCQATLDLDSIESLAVRVLARGLLTQRLVAFVGAGVSAAYGRMTWAGLMRLLWAQIEKDVARSGPDSLASAVWTRIRRELWNDSEVDFLDYTDHATKAQILSNVAALLPTKNTARVARGPGAENTEKLQEDTNWFLQDFHGFVETLADQLSQPAKDDAGDGVQERRRKARESARKLEQEEKEAENRPLEDSTIGLKRVLEVVSNLQSELSRQEDPAALHEAVAAIIRALSRQPNSKESPLRLLSIDWGIRRFITTNYDREIERGLEAAGFVDGEDPDGKVNANQYHVLNFSQAATGQALRFALEGPRRHAALLHLHGDVVDPKSLIVTESHYQRLYLDDHPLRDLVNSATLANFAANSLLFVGSDVSEDDVLRPMRQFMTGEGHRRDRMAVALFITNQPAHKRAQRRVQLWLRYGVYAIDVGAAETRVPAAAKELWLVRLMNCQREFRSPEIVRNAAASTPPTRGRIMAARRAVAETLGELGVPVTVEGLPVDSHPEFNFDEALAKLKGHIAALPADASEGDFKLRRALLLFDITVSWICGCFLCAKLISLRRRAAAVIEKDARLALPYQRPDQAYARAEPDKVADCQCPPRDPRLKAVNLRHAVLTDHPRLKGRFSQIEAGEALSFSEGIDDLCAAIGACDHFPDIDHRRVIIVCGSRGQGKGGQSDRLISARHDDPGFPYLRQLLGTLRHYSSGAQADDYSTARVVHANLSFSNELGTIISQVIGVMRDMWQAPATPVKSTDQLEELGRCLHGLSQQNCNGRLLLILGNAGVLFDADGIPKNGQIRRVMRTLLAERFRAAKLDILMYVGESQVPAAQRVDPDSKGERDANHGDASNPSKWGDMRRRRRLHRLGIKGQPPRENESTLVHAMRGTRVSQLARAYFPAVADAMGWARPTTASGGAVFDPPLKGSPAYELALRLYRVSGGSRFGQTLLLAWLDTACWLREPPNARAMPSPQAVDLAELAFSSLRSVPAASAVEAVVEFVLDRWGALHLGGERVPEWVLPRPSNPDDRPVGLLDMHSLCQPLTRESWALATELMWHLSAFSHPVEANVLAVCPRVAAAAAKLQKVTGIAGQRSIAAMLELLVHWCLLFRVRQRPLPEMDKPLEEDERVRYAPHRHMQRHFLRLMGGRNIESTAWDQFTTSIYASLPNESPLIRAEVHQALVDVVHRLTGYPKRNHLARAPVADSPDWTGRTVRNVVQQADCIRAAYYLVRSTYSLGVVSHLTAEASDRAGSLGHMEQYRRLVRWITHAARNWESRHGIRHVADNPEEKVAQGWCRSGKPVGLFYPGELVWLYNECGVISLAQGKLHDAEQLLTLAESAARMVEADDSGSLHTRIRLQSALVQIERGRPQRARQILKPISERRNGHPVPPFLAMYYLGQVEHIGGNYEQAVKHYERALEGLRERGQSRAAAFVLMGKADVAFALRPAEIDAALATADEAISLAQQGGHEDLRVMATVARARICVEAGRLSDKERIFEHLSFAQRYAVLMDIPRLACDVHELRARLLMRQGEFHLSARDATVGLEIAALYDLKLKKARGLLTLSEIYLRRGENDGARSLATMGKEVAVSCDYYACVRGFKELELMLRPHPSAFV